MTTYAQYQNITRTQDIAKGVYKRMQGRRKKENLPNFTTPRKGVQQGATIHGPRAGSRGTVSRRERKFARTGEFHKAMYRGGGPTLKHVLTNLKKARGSGKEGNIDRLKTERNQLLAKRSRLLEKMVPGPKQARIKGAKLVGKRPKLGGGGIGPAQKPIGKVKPPGGPDFGRPIHRPPGGGRTGGPYPFGGGRTGGPYPVGGGRVARATGGRKVRPKRPRGGRRVPGPRYSGGVRAPY